MPSYSVNLNAVVAQAATAVTRLQVVCAYGGSDTQVCVATAANLALAGGRLRGVALENQAAGFPIQIIDYGSVNATLTGTGTYVNYDASGNLSLSTTSGTNTVGTYENGVVHVNLDFSSTGGTGGNATSIGGVSVTAASAGISQILAGNGTSIRSRLGTYHMLDFREKAAANLGLALPALDNSANAKAVNAAAWDLALNTLSPGSELRFSRGDWYVGDEWTFWTGTAYHGTLTNILFSFENGRTLGNPGARIIGDWGDPYGIAASITTYTDDSGLHGGSYQWNTMTLTGCTSVSGIAVTMANASKLVGRPVRVWNATNANCNLSSTVCAIPADGTIVVWNPNSTGVAAPDYGLGGGLGSGKVRWQIERALIDMRTRECEWDRAVFQSISSQPIGTMIRVTESPSPAANGSTSTTVTNNRFRNCLFLMASQAQKARCGVRYADDTVPESNHLFYSTNSAGYPLPWHPYQVDVTEYINCFFLGTIGSGFSGVIGVGSSGQAESHHFIRSAFQGVRCGFLSMRSSVGNSNLAHANFYDCDFAHAYDTHVDICTSSFGVQILRCQSEAGGSRLLNDRGGVNARSVTVSDLELQFYGTGATAPNIGHPSHEVITTNSEGVVSVERCNFYTGDSDARAVLALNHSQGAANNRAAVVSFRCNQVVGSRSVAGRRGSVSAGRRGPYAFAGAETLDVKVDGATTTVTFSAANFNTALAVYGGGTYTVNMDRVRGWEVALLLEKYVSGIRAWGSEEDETLTVWSDNRSTGTIQITGGTANTQLGFNTGAIGSATALLQMQKDTNYLVSGSAVSSSDEVELDFASNCCTVSATQAHTTLSSFRKTYPQGGTNTGNQIGYFAGLSQERGAPPRNFWVQIRHDGGTGATFKWCATGSYPANSVKVAGKDWVTEDDNSIAILPSVVARSAAPAAGSDQVVSVTYTLSGSTVTEVVVTVKADPGAGQSNTWHLELRR